MKQIPNLFTLLNLFFGCCAIVFALQTNSIIVYVDGEVSTFNVPEQLALAGIFIGIAGVVDFLDGFVARLFNATSELGKQLDSLADVASFGVAPGVIIYQLLRMSYARETNSLEISTGYLLPAFILSCAAAYRLGKFNLIQGSSYHFRGLPTPAVGLLIASFPLILHYHPALFDAGLLIINRWFLYGCIVILSYLMVSNIPIMGLKFSSFRMADNLPKIILLAGGIVAAIFLKWLAVPVIFLIYILLSLVYKKSLK
jgi:CDP-diacylglycerol---serine O-phosphatidyltransferase